MVSMVRTKSVFSPVERDRDGLRILASRFLGRGLPKEQYDVWMPNLGPSEQLLHGFKSDRIGWPEFKRRYTAELFEGGAIDDRNERIRNHGQLFTLRLLKHLAAYEPITVMCVCPEEQEHCHRHVLKQILDRRHITAK
jgi:uncharacterized protein YeaO (DUF488 family)